jgi:hypothetical protein
MSAVSPAPDKTAPSAKQGNTLVTILTVAVLVLLVLLILGVYYRAVSQVSGLELDVTSWQTRRFAFAADPFSQRQLTAISHTPAALPAVDPAIAAYMTGGPARPASPRWDLVAIQRGATSRNGAAQVLFAYLAPKVGQANWDWVAWTTNHPQQAAVFWGAVRDLIHLDLYTRLPVLFDLPPLNLPHAEFSQRIAATMLQVTLEEARLGSQAGRAAEAAGIARVGLTYAASPELAALAAPE